MTQSLQSSANCRANPSVELEGSNYSTTEYRIAALWTDWIVFYLLLVNSVNNTKLLFFLLKIKQKLCSCAT